MISYNDRMLRKAEILKRKYRHISTHRRKHVVQEKIVPPGEFIVSRAFKDMIGRSYNFNQSVFDSDARWRLLNELYDRNFIDTSNRNYDNLPKKIHQIWLGSKFPDKYKKWADSWSFFNPDWEYRLWTDDNIDDIILPNGELFNSIRNYGQKSDFLRYHILNQFGGIYVDTDFECLKSFDTLSYVSFITGVGFPSKVELYVGLIGSVPGHPIISRIVDSMDRVHDRKWEDIFETTGSYFFTRIFFEVIAGYMEGIVVLPPDYFYPFPNQRGYKHRDGRAYIKDCSYAIHHWETSWLPKR